MEENGGDIVITERRFMTELDGLMHISTGDKKYCVPQYCVLDKMLTRSETIKNPAWDRAKWSLYTSLIDVPIVTSVSILRERTSTRRSVPQKRKSGKSKKRK